MTKVLDLFSGIGGFSLAAHRAGFEVVAHCEIDAFPRAVLAHRLSGVPIFEDVKKLTKDIFYDKTGLDKIDVVVGGSPCQDFSVAGAQRGFGGNRSSLFLEQMRVARELGAKWIVWENVPGVLSSNKGADFGRVLSEFSGWTIPAQKFGGCGFVRARTIRDYSVCYRIYNSQFFGVPQRRRRIYLVASLGGECRPEILFERDGVCGHSAEVEDEKQDIASVAERCFGGHTENAVDNTLILTESSATIQSKSPTLTASMSKIYNRQTPILFENHAQDSRYRQRDDSPTITSRCETGGNNLPLVVKQHNHGEVSVQNFAPTLTASSGAGRTPMTFCVHATQTPVSSDTHAFALGAESRQAVCVAENIIGRQDHNGGNGVGAQEGVSYTLNASGVHGVSTGCGVRRLTPRECERLQGFPDDWTKVPYRGKSAEECPDSLRYKACGNAITVNVGEYVLRRLRAYIDGNI